MIDATCERCGRSVTLAGSHAGKRFRCRGCGALVLVPMPLELPDDAADESGLPVTEGAAWAMFRESYRDSGRMLFGCAVATVALVALVWVVGWWAAPAQQSFRDTMAAEIARADMQWRRGQRMAAQAGYNLALAEFARLESPTADDRALAAHAEASRDAIEKEEAEMEALAVARRAR